MYLERIENGIDILGIVILELLQDLDLMHSDLDAFILCQGIDFVVMGVHVDDFQGDDTIVDLITAKEGWNWSAEHSDSEYLRRSTQKFLRDDLDSTASRLATQSRARLLISSLQRE